MNRWLWPLLILLSILSVAIVTFVLPRPATTLTYTTLITVWFVLICPGMAFVRLLGLTHWLEEWVLAVALSLALSTLVPEVMLYTRLWSPNLSLLVLMALSAVGAGLQVLSLVTFRNSTGVEK